MNAAMSPIRRWLERASVGLVWLLAGLYCLAFWAAVVFFTLWVIAG